jgi:hypothetical protein
MNRCRPLRFLRQAFCCSLASLPREAGSRRATISQHVRPRVRNLNKVKHCIRIPEHRTIGFMFRVVLKKAFMTIGLRVYWPCVSLTGEGVAVPFQFRSRGRRATARLCAYSTVVLTGMPLSAPAVRSKQIWWWKKVFCFCPSNTRFKSTPRLKH